jgi:hypothetical protein
MASSSQLTWNDNPLFEKKKKKNDNDVEMMDITPEPDYNGLEPEELLKPEEVDKLLDELDEPEKPQPETADNITTTLPSPEEMVAKTSECVLKPTLRRSARKLSKSLFVDDEAKEVDVEEEEEDPPALLYDDDDDDNDLDNNVDQQEENLDDPMETDNAGAPTKKRVRFITPNGSSPSKRHRAPIPEYLAARISADRICFECGVRTIRIVSTKQCNSCYQKAKRRIIKKASRRVTKLRQAKRTVHSMTLEHEKAAEAQYELNYEIYQEAAALIAAKARSDKAQEESKRIAEKTGVDIDVEDSHSESEN